MRAPVGGLFRHVYDLANAQAELGHAVGIVADKNAADALTVARLTAIMPSLELGLHLIPMPRQPGLSDISATRSIERLVRDLGPDILHGHGAKGGAYARIAGAFQRLWTNDPPSVFYTPHGGTLHYPPGTVTGATFLAVEKVLAAATSGLIFESAYAQRIYQDRIGRTAAAVRVIPNGLKSEEFEPCPADENAADFVFVGELRTLKGVSVLLEALAALRTKRPIKAVIVGAGPDQATFFDEAKTLGLSDIVEFPGALPAREAFRRGKCLIVPSLAESFPYIVLEAGAAGLPLIATNVGGIPEMVEGTDNTLIRPGDAAALAFAMEKTLTNRDDAERNAAALKSRIAERFTVEAMASQITNFYADARGP